MSRNIVGILVAAVLSGCDPEDREEPVAGLSDYPRDYAWAKDTTGRFQDPVCGESVPSASPWKKVCRGRLFYFHSEDCRNQFCANPQPYTDTPAHHHRTP